jgi:hypothetical protein
MERSDAGVKSAREQPDGGMSFVSVDSGGSTSDACASHEATQRTRVGPPEDGVERDMRVHDLRETTKLPAAARVRP